MADAGATMGLPTVMGGWAGSGPAMEAATVGGGTAAVLAIVPDVDGGTEMTALAASGGC